MSWKSWREDNTCMVNKKNDRLREIREEMEKIREELAAGQEKEAKRKLEARYSALEFELLTLSQSMGVKIRG
jgi:hypothetical protein